MKIIMGVVTVAVALFFSGPSFALDPIQNESGFSGFIAPALGVVNYKGNMISGFNKINVEISDDTTNSLTEEADSETTGMGSFNFELGYNFANTRTRVFVGNRLEDILRFDLSTQLGVIQEIGDLGVVSAGFLFSSIPTSVWEDPYLTNASRDETDRTSTGVRLVWDKILGLNCQLQLDYRDIEIDEEESGTSLGGLTPEERELLDRNGESFKGEFLYRFNVASKHWLTPSIAYTAHDMDGDAMSRDAYTFQLSYLYAGEPFKFIGNALIGKADYDEENPIPEFGGKTQENDIYGLTGSLFYKNPFDWEWFGSDDINFFLTAVYFVSDSNIDFYTTEISMANLGLLYRF